MIDYDAVRETFKHFSSHAKGCTECEPLLRHVCRRPVEPPFDLVKACCEDGKERAEAWLCACHAATYAYKARFGVVKAI